MPTRHWVSGQFGARAIAETLFGHNNPGGKLPYTFYKSSFISKISMDEFGCAKPPGTTLGQCCCWRQSIVGSRARFDADAWCLPLRAGRGYRYLPPDSEDVILPAFHGLSCTRFNISASPAPASITTALTIPVEVANTGAVGGTETVMAFFKPQNRTNPGGEDLLPLQRRLCGFAKVWVAAVRATPFASLLHSCLTLLVAGRHGNRSRRDRRQLSGDGQRSWGARADARRIHADPLDRHGRGAGDRGATHRRGRAEGPGGAAAGPLTWSCTQWKRCQERPPHHAPHRPCGPRPCHRRLRPPRRIQTANGANRPRGLRRPRAQQQQH
eukprot:COSAG04_NODE_1107_length_8233_cov_2.467478_10_plen_326_part_00